jgi:hypothetical protein
MSAGVLQKNEIGLQNSEMGKRHGKSAKTNGAVTAHLLRQN